MNLPDWLDTLTPDQFEEYEERICIVWEGCKNEDGSRLTVDEADLEAMRQLRMKWEAQTCKD